MRKGMEVMERREGKGRRKNEREGEKRREGKGGS
jgi:hypothetical protein